MSNLIDKLEAEREQLRPYSVLEDAVASKMIEIVQEHKCEWVLNERTTPWDGRTYTPSCGMAKQPEWVGHIYCNCRGEIVIVEERE